MPNLADRRDVLKKCPTSHQFGDAGASCIRNLPYEHGEAMVETRHDQFRSVGLREMLTAGAFCRSACAPRCAVRRVYQAKENFPEHGGVKLNAEYASLQLLRTME